MIEILTEIKDIFRGELLFIVVDIILCSLMTIVGILAFGKARKVTHIILVLLSLFLYISMIFRTLAKLKLFVISDYLYFNIPIFSLLLEYFPSVLLLIVFFIILREK